MKKKMIAPIVVTMVFLGIWGFYLAAVWMIPDGISRWFIAIPLIASMACLIWMAILRIKEIKGGNEDDLDNY